MSFDIPYADIPGLLAEACRIIDNSGPRSDSDTFGAEYAGVREQWRQDYQSALPALEKPHGAVITILEELRDGQDPNEHCAVVVPDGITINGMPLLVTDDGPVVEKISMASDAHPAAMVTVTVLARRVLIGADTDVAVDVGKHLRKDEPVGDADGAPAGGGSGVAGPQAGVAELEA